MRTWPAGLASNIGDTVAQRHQAADQRQQLANTLADLEHRRDAIAEMVSPSKMDALIDGAKAHVPKAVYGRTDGCEHIEDRRASTWCNEILELKARRADAEQRDGFEKTYH
jgi:hypothetical protein